jgi:hypothetical protein
MPGLKPHCWGEDLRVVNSMNLRVAHGYQARLEFLDGIVRAAFNFEHPFVLDDFLLCGARD